MNNRLILTAVLVTYGLQSTTFAEELTRDELAFFESKIRPVLVKECFACHSDRTGKIRGGLRLDTAQQMQVGGESGPAVVPGKPDQSLLFTAMTHESMVMPPRRKLSDQVIEDFRQWIEMGAPDPRSTAAVPVKSTVTKADIRRARENFWAYQPIRKLDPPAVESADWAKTNIDRFVLAKLEQAELMPNEDDVSYRLLRRLSYDLVGLPPTLAQIEAFDEMWDVDQDAAIVRVVDFYLEQPQFGERWGRHWLDVARYAESTGHSVNLTYPHAWRYRDYVIDSFNADKPYDEFVQEQIAGDLLPAKDDETWAEQLVATTFLAIGPKNINDMDSLQFRADLIDEQVDATSRVFLGMSLACARCHDHKFDAIPQSDYYAMSGFFESTNTFFGSPLPSTNPMVQQDSGILEYPMDDPGPGQKTYSQAELSELKQQIASLQSQMGQGKSFAGIQRRIYKGQLENELAGIDANGRPISYCMGVQCSDRPRDATLLLHGEVDQLGDVIPRGFPSVVSMKSTRIDKRTSGRRQLAQWMTDKDNPLTARVMVNRVWHHMLGRGIVASPNDFGATGQPPSHPKLLDYLAAQFINSDWSVKSLVRQIATSRVYRLQTSMNEEAYGFDPENSLLWRAHPRRLDAESIRDSMLAVSGQLDLQRPHGSEIAIAGFVRIRNGVLEELSNGVGGMGGRMGMAGGGMGPGNRMQGARMGQAGGGMGGRMQRGPGGGMNSRFGGRTSAEGSGNDIPPPDRLDMVEAKFRSVYMPQARNETPRSLAVFDAADSNAVVGRRATSDTADQALYVLNNPFVIAQSKAFADRLTREAKTQPDRVRRAFLLAYGREPRPEEMRGAITLLNDVNRQDLGMQLLCQSLFASAEFRYAY
ncbi:MAG: PSD1 and planctomycete cytochrome C domain-containing protein [Planctomycetota bacterium]